MLQILHEVSQIINPNLFAEHSRKTPNGLSALTARLISLSLSSTTVRDRLQF